MNRVTEIFPRALVEALLPIGRVEPPWLKLTDEGTKYGITFRSPPPDFLKDAPFRGKDWIHALLLSRWLAHGPKVARPSPARCDAMAQVEVRLQMDDLALPFPEILVELPDDRFAPFHRVLLGSFQDPGDPYPMFAAACLSPDGKRDIINVIGQRFDPGWTVETTLARYEPDCEEDAEASKLAVRVALNCCLTLSGTFRPALPAEEDRDRRLARENTDRGERARDRLRTSVQLADFDQEIAFSRTERRRTEPGEPTGRKMPPHWRKGHWHTVCHGPSHSLRKRKLFPAVFVRFDLFTGDLSDTSVTYNDPKAPKETTPDE